MLKDKVIKIMGAEIELVDEILVLNGQYSVLYSTNDFADLVEELKYDGITEDEITVAPFEHRGYMILLEPENNQYFLVDVR